MQLINYGTRFLNLMLLILVQSILATSLALACPTIAGSGLPTGTTGQIAKVTAPNKLMFCNGSTWQDFGGSPTADACTVDGQVNPLAGEARYCNQNVFWRFDSGATTNGACTNLGQVRFNSGNTRIEFCNGTNWRVVSTDANADALTFGSVSNRSWLSTAASLIQRVTGFTGGTPTFNNTGPCVFTQRVCNDPACASQISATTTPAYVANGQYLRLSILAAESGLTTCSFEATFGTTTYSYTITTAAIDTSPLAATFPGLYQQATSSTVSSAIVQIQGHSGVSISIGDLGTNSSPEYRTCNDATCTSVSFNWTSSANTLSTGQWVQMRLTTATGIHLKRARLTTGSTTHDWFASTGTCPEYPVLAAGASLTCSCPAGMLNLPTTGSGSLRNPSGSSPYRMASNPCLAAIHAGGLNDATGGTITLTANTPLECVNFYGSTANGVTTGNISSPNSAMHLTAPITSSSTCPP